MRRPDRYDGGAIAALIVFVLVVSLLTGCNIAGGYYYDPNPVVIVHHSIVHVHHYVTHVHVYSRRR